MPFINKVTLPTGNTYNYEGTLYTVGSTQTSATSTWLGNASAIEALKSGTTIAYYLAQDSTSTAVTLTLTLADGTNTGAKNVFFKGTTRLSNQFSSGSLILMTYDGTAWHTLNYTDTNTDTKVTSVANHYLPSADASAKITVTASGGSDADWGTTQLLTGFEVQRDAAGHVTGVTPTSKKLPVPSTTDTQYTFADGTTLGTFKVTPSTAGATTQTVSVGDVSTTVTQDENKLITSGAVWTAIDNLPEPMIFKGTVGTGGTVTWSNLPSAASSNQGHTYKVITKHTTAPICEVGDVITSNGSEWVVIPSGDETFTDTWRNIKVDGTEKLGSAITTGAIDFISGTNVTLSFNSSGNKLTITADDTVRAINVNGTQLLGTAKSTGAVNFKNGSNVTITGSGNDITISSTDSDSYVNAASFADDSTNNNVKMTLTRTGTTTGSVTANIPKVSSSTSGVAPKGEAVSAQDVNTKFLRSDGTWSAPTQTTYNDAKAVTGVTASIVTSSSKSVVTAGNTYSVSNECLIIGAATSENVNIVGSITSATTTKDDFLQPNA